MGSVSSKSTVYAEPLKIVQGHSACINCLAVSADKTIFASGSDDCTIRLWSPCGPEEDYLRCYQILVAHTNYITTLTFFRDKLLSGSADRDIRKWDTKTGQCLMVLTGHDDVINSILCSRNHVFTASNDKTAMCWDFDSGQVVTQFKGHTHNVNAITCSGACDAQTATFNGTGSADSKDSGNNPIETLIHKMGPRECVYTGSADKTAKAWSIRSGKCLFTFKGHTAPITQVAVDKEGHILYTASLDATVRSWFTESAKPQFVFEGHKRDIVCFELHEKMLYTGSTDRTMKSWLLSTGALVRSYGGHKRTVNKVHKEEPYVFSASDDGYLRCFEEKTGNVCFIYGNKTIDGCNAYGVTENYVITTDNKGQLFVWTKWNANTAEPVEPVLEEIAQS